MSEGDHSAEKDRVPGRTARADQISCHDGFAVPGGHRVYGAEHESYGQPREDHTPAELALVQQVRQVIVARRGLPARLSHRSGRQKNRQ